MTFSRLSIVTLLSVLALTACKPSTGTTGQTTSSAAMSSATAQKPPVTEPSSSVSNVPPRVVTMIATNFAFSPSALHFKKGEKIILKVTSEVGTHGVAIPEFHINEILRPGETVSIDIPTDKTGTFNFFCSVPCGAGHAMMQGTILID